MPSFPKLILPSSLPVYKIPGNIQEGMNERMDGWMNGMRMNDRWMNGCKMDDARRMDE